MFLLTKLARARLCFWFITQSILWFFAYFVKKIGKQLKRNLTNVKTLHKITKNTKKNNWNYLRESITLIILPCEFKRFDGRKTQTTTATLEYLNTQKTVVQNAICSELCVGDARESVCVSCAFTFVYDYCYYDSIFIRCLQTRYRICRFEWGFDVFFGIWTMVTLYFGISSILTTVQI